MPHARILTINTGSSSIKFAVFTSESQPQRLLSGLIDRIGQGQTTIDCDGERYPIEATDHRAAAERLIDWLQSRLDSTDTSEPPFEAMGQRVVHGGFHLFEPKRIDDETIAALEKTRSLNPVHLPRIMAVIDAFRGRFPKLPQVAVFDTAFHRDMPRVAHMLPLPREYGERGLRRFGFHGISYTYLLEQLKRIAPQQAHGRVIFAHLGNGASMAAVHSGRPIDTTMGLTPTEGLVMGTRTGNLDPGVIVYLLRTEKLSPDDLDRLLNNRSGLIGVSQTSSDMRDLLARRKTDMRAAEAVELFHYRARQWIGALAASMGGLDVLVFSGGMGEHSTETRAGICTGLEFLGVRIDNAKNRANDGIISEAGSRVTVRVMRTDEEIVIAKTVRKLLGLSRPGNSEDQGA